MTIPVVVLSDGFVLVLSSSIPDLQFDLDSLELYDFEYVIDADGHHVVLHELPLAVAQQNVALAHSGIPNDDDFLKVVEAFLFLAFYLA